MTAADGNVQRAPGRQPDGNIALEPGARRGRAYDKQREVLFRDNQLETGRATEESSRGAAPPGEDSFGNYSKERRVERAARETVNEAPQPRGSNVVRRIFVDPAENDSTSSMSASSPSTANAPGETDPGRRTARLKDSGGDRASLGGLNSGTTRGDPGRSARQLRQVSLDRAIVGPSHRSPDTERRITLDHETQQTSGRRIAAEDSRTLQSPMTANSRVPSDSQAAQTRSNEAKHHSAGRSDKPARHRFASADLAMPALSESSESMWPTLPPSRDIEITDELAALDREIETLRRLDREQRGTLWNA